MGEGLKRRFPAATRRGVRAATLTALVCVAAVTALLPAGAGAADGPGARIYWSNESGAIRFANVNGSGGTTLFGEGGGPCGVALDPAAGKAYWTNWFSGEIRAANLDGSGTASTLFTEAGSVCGVAFDRAAGKIYWANYGADAIRVANLDGTGVAATLFAEPPGSGPSGVVIDRAAGKIYWTNQHSNEVRIANLDGSGTASTLFGPAEAGDNPIGLAIDPAAGKVYWAAFLSGQIRVGNLDGSEAPSTLFASEDGPGGVALDTAAGTLYWGTFSGGKIRAGNLDGSGSASTLVEGEGAPLFPALLQAPQANAAPTISGGASLGVALSCSPGGWKSDLDGAFLFRSPRTFAYQWQLDGTDIPGATTSSFTFTDPGDYTCSVTAANVAGSSSQTSAAFTVTLLDVMKYYDKNTNGNFDPSEIPIPGWKVRVGSTAYSTPKSLKVDPGVYQVTEVSPKQTNWLRTTAASVQVSAAAGDRATVRFGNVCVGAGGALGTGFWGNKNGQALFGSDDLALMVSLNLRNGNGSTFDPTSYKAFASWLQGSTSTNMAYVLSANLAAMKLNVLNGKVGGSLLISAPGTGSANPAGFATVNDLTNEANAELGLHGLTTSGSPFRTDQTALRDALSNANENKTFVQPAACSFSFP